MKSFKDVLGNKTWNFLHEIAEGFPHNPKPSETRYWYKFVNSLSKIYPCEKCKHHFQSYVKTKPPLFLTKKNAIDYFNIFHDKVNERLGKPLFHKII